MTRDQLLDLLNNLCNMFMQDGEIHEETIERLVDAGADYTTLKEIGFNDEQISEYAYYESNMSGQPEEEILAELQGAHR